MMVYFLLSRLRRASRFRVNWVCEVQQQYNNPPSVIRFRAYSRPPSGLARAALAQVRTLHVGVQYRNREIKEKERLSVRSVKQVGRDFTYMVVVLVGLGVTGGLLYVVFKELFSSSSPSKLYGKALNKCRAHPEVIGAFGEPIKGYRETSRRGRRQQVSHAEYTKDGLKHMRLKFYIEGSEPGLHGTVHSDSRENPETGKYEFRYIFVDVDTYPRRTIVVEDNR